MINSRAEKKTIGLWYSIVIETLYYSRAEKNNRLMVLTCYKDTLYYLIASLGTS